LARSDRSEKAAVKDFVAKGWWRHCGGGHPQRPHRIAKRGVEFDRRIVSKRMFFPPHILAIYFKEAV